MFYVECWPPPVTLDAFGYRNITDHSFLKVYHKDPAHAFSHNARPPNGDSRVSAQPRPSRTHNGTGPPSCPSALFLLVLGPREDSNIGTPPQLLICLLRPLFHRLFPLFFWCGWVG